MTTFMNREIEDGVTDHEGKPAKVEVTASIGEFEGTLLALTTPENGYALVELDFEAAHRLMLALQDALNIHAEQE